MWPCVPLLQDSLGLHRDIAPPLPEDTTTDHSPEGEWKEVVSKKKKKRTGRNSSPRAKKEQSMVLQRTPSSPKKVQQIKSPLLDLSREERTDVGATKEYPLHENYDLDEVMTDKLENRDCRYVIIRAYRQQREEESINVDLPAYIYFIDDEPAWFFAKGPTSTLRRHRKTFQESKAM